MFFLLLESGSPLVVTWAVAFPLLLLCSLLDDSPTFKTLGLNLIFKLLLLHSLLFFSPPLLAKLSSRLLTKKNEGFDLVLTSPLLASDEPFESTRGEKEEKPRAVVEEVLGKKGAWPLPNRREGVTMTEDLGWGCVSASPAEKEEVAVFLTQEKGLVDTRGGVVELVLLAELNTERTISLELVFCWRNKFSLEELDAPTELSSPPLVVADSEDSS